MSEWKDKDGNIHEISKMDTNHLVNAMKFAEDRCNTLEFTLSVSSNPNDKNTLKMKIKYLRNSVNDFKVELRERRLNYILNKDNIDLDDIGLDYE